MKSILGHYIKNTWLLEWVLYLELAISLVLLVSTSSGQLALNHESGLCDISAHKDVGKFISIEQFWNPILTVKSNNNSLMS